MLEKIDKFFRGLSILLAATALIWLCVWLALNQRVSSLHYDLVSGELQGDPWKEAPRTAFGVIIAKMESRQWPHQSAPDMTGESGPPYLNLYFHAGIEDVLVIFNRIARFWLQFLFLPFLGWALVRPLSIWAPNTRWKKAAYYVVGSCFIIGGGGFLVSFSAKVPFPWLTWPPLFAVCVFAVVCGVELFVDALLERHSIELKAWYGPNIRPPGFSGGGASWEDRGIVIGASAAGVLPEFTRNYAERTEGSVTEGNIAIPFESLAGGVSVLGASSTGKSHLLYMLHDGLRKRDPKLRILIYDPKARWYDRYYDPATDLVFAPHLKPTDGWSIRADMRKYPELALWLARAAFEVNSKNQYLTMVETIEVLAKALGQKTSREAAMTMNLYRLKKEKERWWDEDIYGFCRQSFLDAEKIESAADQAGRAKVRSIDEFLDCPGRVFLIGDRGKPTDHMGVLSLFLTAYFRRSLARPAGPDGRLAAAVILDEAPRFPFPDDLRDALFARCKAKTLAAICCAESDRLHPIFRGVISAAEQLICMKTGDDKLQGDLSRKAGEIVMVDGPKRAGRTPEQAAAAAKFRCERRDVIPPEHFGRLGHRQFILFHPEGLAAGSTANLEAPSDQWSPALYSLPASPDFKSLAASLR